MRKNQRRVSRGAVAIMIVHLALVVFVVMVAGVRLGLISLQKQEHQNQADAVALGATWIAKEKGLGDLCNHPDLAALAHGNRTTTSSERVTTCPTPRRVQESDGSSHLTFQVEASDEVNHAYSDVMALSNENIRLDAWGTGQLVEHSFDEVQRLFPKLVLVLDYSGSMRANFGSTTRLKELQKAVNALLDMELRVEYGAVLFSTDVLQTVAIDYDDRQQDIRNAISRSYANMTNYPVALRHATNLLLDTEDTGWYILFVTDGLPEWYRSSNHRDYCGPECGGPISLDLADEIRAAGITIFTLFIGSDSQAEQLLRDMSGSSSRPGDPECAFVARNAEQLHETFRRIVSSILCTVGPISPAPPEGTQPEDVHVFLSIPNEPNEIPLDFTWSVGDYPDDYRYSYDPGENKVSLSERACDAVIDLGATLQVRYGSIELRE